MDYAEHEDPFGPGMTYSVSILTFMLMSPSRRILIASVALSSALLAACSPIAPEPVREQREALGTFVEITAYGVERETVRGRIADAFEAIDAIEGQTDAHDPDSAIGRFNADPFDAEGPPEALTRIENERLALDIGPETFHTGLLGLTRLYDFEGEGRVPSEAELASALAEAGSLRLSDVRPRFHPASGRSDGTLPLPGIDLGGAAKGLALDRAATVLTGGGGVDAAVITAGSSTLSFGEKPGGGPWRIGIEDPRDTGRIIAVVEARSGVSVSTSGDYQRFFERAGTRYHHILDPRTGLPARGLRSLTVIGETSAVSTDILSTALFVMGPLRASAYARAHGYALHMVDDEGRALVVPAPSDASFSLVEPEPPTP